LSKYVENVEEAIEEAGMMTRTIDDEPTDPAPEPVTQEIELDDEMFEMIVERVIAELEDQFAKIADSIVTLTQNVELLTGQAKERQTKVDERIDALEADDDEKQRQWLADMPRRDKQRLLVTHRPSGNPTNDEPPTAAERAEVALDGWNVDHYKQ
jgi:TolA-binding protein